VIALEISRVETEVTHIIEGREERGRSERKERVQFCQK
jgi:hypothetical protein